MIIHHDPDAFVGISGGETCEFHKKNPGVSFAGCTCSGFWGMRPATPEEYRENRRKRLTKRVALLTEELAEARRELKALGPEGGS